MKRLSLLFVIVAGLLVTGAVASALPAADEPVAIPVGVTIGGVQVGGLAPDAATAAVQQAFDTPLELELGTTRVLVTPDVLGAAPVIDRAIERALAAEPNAAIPLGVSIVTGTPAAFVATLAKRYDRPAIDSKLSLRNLRPWLSKERAGRKLVQRQSVRDIAAAVTSGVRTGIVLPAHDASTGGHTPQLRAGDRHPSQVQPPLPLRRLAVSPPLRRRDGSVAVPDAARPLLDRRQVEEPMVVST